MCLSPVHIRLTGSSYSNYRQFLHRESESIQVPCGHCLACKQAYQDSWSARITEEYAYHHKGVFFTLTYNEATVPINYYKDGYLYRSEPGYRSNYERRTVHKSHDPHFNCQKVDEACWKPIDCSDIAFADFAPFDADRFLSVRKADVQRWIKRFRKKLSKSGLNFTYYITSEYGPNGTHRPHYHGFFFGIDALQASQALMEWRDLFGFVKYQNIDPSKGAAFYVSKYCSKGSWENPWCQKDFYYPESKKMYVSKHFDRVKDKFGVDMPLADPTFHLVSKHFGENYVTTHKDWHLAKDWFPDIQYNEFGASTQTTYQDDYSKAFNDSDYIQSRLAELVNSANQLISDRKFYVFKQRPFSSRKVYRCSLPLYYVQKIFPPQTRLQVSALIQQKLTELYSRKCELISSCHPDWDSESVLRYITSQEKAKFDSVSQKFYQSNKAAFSKSKL